MVERGQNNRRKKRNQYQGYDYLLRPFFLVLRPSREPPLQERLIVKRKIDREADGRGTEDREEKPALPIMERACRPEDERNKKNRSKYPLDNRSPIEWVHTNTVTPSGPVRLIPGAL